MDLPSLVLCSDCDKPMTAEEKQRLEEWAGGTWDEDEMPFILMTLSRLALKQ